MDVWQFHHHLVIYLENQEISHPLEIRQVTLMVIHYQSDKENYLPASESATYPYHL